MDKNLTFDGKTENDFNFNKAIDYKSQWYWADLKCSMSVNIYENNMRPFINTYQNIEEMITNIKNKNPHLFYSFEPIDRLTNYWWKQTHLNGISWRSVCMEILNKRESDCMYSFDIPFNPYYELTEEEVLEMENNLRTQYGLETVEKFFRNE